MRVRLIARTLLPLALALVPGLSSMLEAQSPPDGAELVRLMHDRYVGKWYRTLSFTQATQRRTAADTLVRETWYESMKLPGRLRIDVGAPDGDPVIRFARDSVYVKRGPKTMAPRAGRNDLLLLGFDVYAQPIEKSVGALREEGFDLSRIHQENWEGRRVFVVGARAGDSAAKQFWVDVERLVFVRMLAPAGPGQTQDEVRFDDYQPAGGGWVSTLVTATRDGRLVQKEQYSNIRVNEPVPDERLDPDRLTHP